MNHVKFVIGQFVLFTLLLIVNSYADSYISKPFSRVDFIAICVSAPIFMLIVSLIGRLYRRFNTTLRNKVLLSITAFILSVIFLALLENLWFE